MKASSASTCEFPYLDSPKDQPLPGQYWIYTHRHRLLQLTRSANQFPLFDKLPESIPLIHSFLQLLHAAGRGRGPAADYGGLDFLRFSAYNFAIECTHVSSGGVNLASLSPFPITFDSKEGQWVSIFVMNCSFSS